MSEASRPLRPRSRLGKYRLEKRLGEGAFAAVFRAYDTIEGVRVALKIPHTSALAGGGEADILREVRLAARLQHRPGILPLKSADYIDDRLVLVYPLGDRTLDERLRMRLRRETALEYFRQMLKGVASAHEERVVHCDIKPDNLILIDDELYLTDFGIAKIALRTLRASGSGTVGYCAPDQAMGKPSFRSDVFSAGLVGYRMLAGVLPEWPFDWPPPGIDRLSSRYHPDLISILQRAMQPDPRRRFATGGAMLNAYERIAGRAILAGPGEKAAPKTKNTLHWQEVQWRQFQKELGRTLECRYECGACGGPVSEPMTTCPWCGSDRTRHDGPSRFPLSCPRCHRGMKSDWHYCPWCYGPGFEPASARSYSDKRYVARCIAPRCDDRRLMAFMRYCPWCHTKVKRRWTLGAGGRPCRGCGWGVAEEYWNYCPWCSKSV